MTSKTAPLPNFSFYLFLAIALAACGPVVTKLKDSKKSGTTVEAIKEVDKSRLTGVDFKDQCLVAKSGRFSDDGQYCLVPHIVDLPEASRGSVVIDPEFTDGKLLVASAVIAGPVDILLNGIHLADLPVHEIASKGSGELSFYVKGSDYLEVSATVWTCYDQSMKAVACSAAATKNL